MTKREMLHDIEPNPHPARAWHAATPPVCPECGVSHEYPVWADRDALRSLYAERDALRKELGYWKSVVEDPFLYWGQDEPPYPLYPDDDDDAAPGGEGGTDGQ